ncbi:SCY1-like protein 2, partial [Lecanoromycetidae sp. Uapishka_2]
MFTSALKSFTSNISSNYTISTTPTSLAGAWKVYDGKKKSTGKAVSVFVFERKALDPNSGGLGGRSGGGSLRKLHDEVIARVKKESNLLARLRHPSILELAEPIEDTRNGGLMFATEPVTASLGGLLQEKDEQERAGGVAGRPSRYVVEEADGQRRRRELEIDELEIQKGLLQVAQGLEFLHESAGLIHGNLSPDAIFVNVKSDWKIAGFGFAGPPDNASSQQTMPPISLSEALYHEPRLPRCIQLDLDYTSPDFAMDSNISAGADIFLDALPAKTPNEKSAFMRGLPKILDQFPKSVLEKKVLPALLEETKDKELLSLVLQNVFKTIRILPSGQRAMSDRVLPQLRETFLSGGGKTLQQERDSAKEAGLVVVLENIDLIGENCNGKEFKNDALPILQLGLDSPTHAIVDKALGCLPTVLAVLDFSTIKNEVFPVVASVFSKTSSLGIKVRGLEAFVILCGGSPVHEKPVADDLDGVMVAPKKPKPSSNAVLDKYTVQEKVVPLLKVMKTKEPAVMMAALAVFKQVGKIVDTDFLAIEAIPILWNFSLGPLLNLEQFQAFMDLIKKLSTRIETEQMRKLRDLSNSNANDMIKTNDQMSTRSTNGLFDSNGSVDAGQNDFERLVLGKGKSESTSNGMLGSTLQPQAPASKQSEAPKFSWTSSPPNINASNSMSGVLKPQSRTITPDQAFGGFATLNPTSSAARPNTNIAANGFSTLTLMQPSHPWAASTSQQPFHTSGFAMAPPPQPPVVTPFSQFSLPPPPISPAQQIVAQSQNSGYFGAQSAGSTGQKPTATSQLGQKSGLDKYESLI